MQVPHQVSRIFSSKNEKVGYQSLRSISNLNFQLCTLIFDEGLDDKVWLKLLPAYGKHLKQQTHCG
uniref:Uncharacterized protein n=1 Tax=Romanomermis culicivorax TaxID=13658 RepID=A0A915HJJ6_ROMCU